MLSQENNDLLTRVGPGTPMGQLMREYWIPALLSSELPEPDCAPVRVLLLCERLVAFRDTRGKVGLLEDACPHRGAALFFGRSEDCGLRCAYHGWKFDVTGACVEMPTEPADSSFRHKVRARAYPCLERGGVVWAYMGPRAVPPALPELDTNADGGAPPDIIQLDCNWLQNLEANLDLVHIPHLHTNNFLVEKVLQGATAATLPPRRPPPPPPQRIEVSDTSAGFAFAASMPDQMGKPVWQVGHFLFPFFANLPFGRLASSWVSACVPLDDHHTMVYGMWRPGTQRAPVELMFGSDPAYLPNTSEWTGRFRPHNNRRNDYGLDRARQRQGTSGIPGHAMEDFAIAGSMGPIVDRTKEHLGTGDIPIIHLRQRLLGAMRGLAEHGAPGLETPGAYRVKHGVFMVSKPEVAWHEELRRLGGAGA